MLATYVKTLIKEPKTWYEIRDGSNTRQEGVLKPAFLRQNLRPLKVKAAKYRSYPREIRKSVFFNPWH